MSVPDERLNVSIEEYLSLEERSDLRHEFVDGRLFAMTGTSLRHNMIAGNFYALLAAHLKGSQCRVFMSDVKVRVEATNSFYYPDVLISCMPTDTSSVYLKTPVLIVEVLSPSTAAIDRREKLFAYRQIPTLAEYVIVHQSRAYIEIMRKTASGDWQSTVVFERGKVQLNCIPCGVFCVEIAEIYEGVDWSDENQDDKQSDSWLVREAPLEESWLSW